MYVFLTCQINFMSQKQCFKFFLNIYGDLIFFFNTFHNPVKSSMAKPTSFLPTQLISYFVEHTRVQNVRIPCSFRNALTGVFRAFKSVFRPRPCLCAVNAPILLSQFYRGRHSSGFDVASKILVTAHAIHVPAVQ